MSCLSAQLANFQTSPPSADVICTSPLGALPREQRRQLAGPVLVPPGEHPGAGGRPPGAVRPPLQDDQVGGRPVRGKIYSSHLTNIVNVGAMIPIELAIAHNSVHLLGFSEVV